MPKMKLKSNSSTNPSRPSQVSGTKTTHTRSRATINRLNMYSQSGSSKSKKSDLASNSLCGNKPLSKTKTQNARITPNRRWFGNTRVISQNQLDSFRSNLEDKINDPYTLLLKRKKLPLQLLMESTRHNTGKALNDKEWSSLSKSKDFSFDAGMTNSITIPRPNILTMQSFDEVFGPKKTRKRPKLSGDVSSLADLVSKCEKTSSEFNEKLEVVEQRKFEKGEDVVVLESAKKIAREDIFQKGQSKRIWGELHKVIDCSDVLIQVLDARDPLGTKSPFIEKHLAENAPHKHMIYLINKVDLVPNTVTQKWIRILSKSFPTLAFNASLTRSFGKGSLIQLLRQFGEAHKDKKQISVGFIGYPNVGKSSVINALKSKKVCKTAPIPGETKVWQYILLFKRIFLIDCPGVVYPDKTIIQSKILSDLPEGGPAVEDWETDLKYEAELIIKGVVRAERLEAPEDYMPYILSTICKSAACRRSVFKHYDIENDADGENAVNENWEEFLVKIAKKRGRLLKGGEPDFRSVAKQIIYDLQRGKLPYFIEPDESLLKTLEEKKTR